MEGLLERNRDFVGCVKRNIVAIVSAPFDDLAEGHSQATEIAGALASSTEPDSLISAGFAYSAAIAYPFATDHWMASRYSDGAFPVWYGALSLETTLHETAYHMARHELGVEGVLEGPPVVRKRHAYDVDCRALLIDLVGQEQKHPDLVLRTSYTLTQQIGRRLSEEGHPGLLAPSARHADGTCLAAFQERILSNPRLAEELVYTLHAHDRRVVVDKPSGETLLEIAVAP